MRVSVVVCVRDGEPWLEEALGSIAAQTRPPDELVVVDDGSADGSMAVVARHDARVVAGPRAGVAAAHDAGIAAATGDAIGFLGQDDRYAAGALAALVGALEQDPGAGFARGRALLFTDEDAHFSGLRDDRLGEPQAARLPENVLIRREVLARALPLRHDAAWDLDLFLRLDELGVACAETDAIVCHKRLRPDSIIHTPGGAHQSRMLEALHAAIARRRGAA
jgi:glycosyltransferase involved in cell wall biosynthesis